MIFFALMILFFHLIAIFVHMNHFKYHSRANQKFLFVVLMLLFSPMGLWAIELSTWTESFEKLQRQIVPQSGVANVAALFLGVPYVAHTLDHSSEEPLTIHFEGLDCTTFVETALALWLLDSGATSQDFAQQLEQIRYRGGVRDNYLSRLHYFSEWGSDNVQKGYLEPICVAGVTELRTLPLYFMSTHADKYPLLQQLPSGVDSMRMVERRVSQLQQCVCSKEKVSRFVSELQAGDVVAFTSAVAGLDVLHVGFVFEVEGQKRLLHAPSVGKVVEISALTIEQIVNNRKNYSGMMAWRPIKR